MNIRRVLCLFLASSAIGGCNYIGGNTPLSSRPAVSLNQEQMLLRGLQDTGYICDPDCYSFNAQLEGEDIMTFVDAGFSLSNYYCGEFFRTISLKSRRRQNAGDLSNNIGGAAATVLGLAKAGSGITGGVAAGFSFIESGFNDYDSAFLVTTEINTIQGLVTARQEQVARETRSSPPANVFQAVSAIQKHSDVCTFTGMQTLLQSAVVERTNDIQLDLDKE
ncbi:MAG: hypothetical protein WA957_12780 [Alteraurantiacibacter sp.]